MDIAESKLCTYLLVKHIIGMISYDWCIDKVLYPVWTTLHVQSKIPIRPTDCPVIQILKRQVHDDKEFENE